MNFKNVFPRIKRRKGNISPLHTPHSTVSGKADKAFPDVFPGGAMNGHWKGKLLLENLLSTFYTISLFPNTLTTPNPSAVQMRI